MKVLKSNIGLTADGLSKVIKVLSNYLAGSYYLYLKTHSFHWNVTGIHFQSLHKLFDEQYNSLFASLDDIAERIRFLNEFVPATYAQFKELTSLKETKEVPKDTDMLKMLVDDHETVIRNLRNWIEEIESTRDVETIDFFTERIETHEKMAWMLRSHLN